MVNRDEWVEAGARAIGAHRTGNGWERDEDTWRHYTQIVEWALAALEPLIRADERERIKTRDLMLDGERSTGWHIEYLEDGIKEAVEFITHAEAVAARLVEVICEQESLIVWNIRWREQAEADRAHLRAQIAAEIEAARDHFAERTDTPREHPLCLAYDDAARIARGEKP